MYITIKTLFNIKYIELIRNKKSVTITLDLNNEIFIVYIAFLAYFNLNIYPPREAWVDTGLVPIVVSFNYADFANIFSFVFIAKLMDYIGINNPHINLVEN